VNIPILPLAITMMAGPQIMSAVVFVTTKRPVRVSLAFVVAVLIATTVGVVICQLLVSALGIDLGDSDDNSSTGNVIQLVLIGLLILLLLAAAVRNYVNRETVEPPKWLGALMEADPKQAFRTGLMVIFFMPSDIVIMLTVATNLEQDDQSVVAALPFIGATVLIAALPLLAYLLFHRRAVKAMPKVRDWMNVKAWLVNIIVCGIFIALLLSDA
jgi:Sap, sulfolipid-1-addressing protein